MHIHCCFFSFCRNVNPTLPYEDSSFDVVTCVVSIDYLIKPIEILKEVNVYCSSFCSYFASALSSQEYPS